MSRWKHGDLFKEGNNVWMVAINNGTRSLVTLVWEGEVATGKQMFNPYCPSDSEYGQKYAGNIADAVAKAIS